MRYEKCVTVRCVMGDWWMADPRCVPVLIIQKKRGESVLSLVPTVRGLRMPISIRTSNAEAHAGIWMNIPTVCDDSHES